MKRLVNPCGGWAGLLTLLVILFAGAAEPAQAQPVPPGSYLSTCRDVRVRHHGRDLQAMCPTRRGFFNPTTLSDFNSCRGDISNQDGNLWCERRRGPPPGGPGFGPGPGPGPGPRPGPGPGPQSGPIPPGPYLQTCRNVRVIGLWLGADCRDMNGRWRDARLNLQTCGPRSNIVNFNGALVCR